MSLYVHHDVVPMELIVQQLMPLDIICSCVIVLLLYVHTYEKQ